jgi:spore maturation protein CgeB
VLLVAAVDDAQNAHGAHRARALVRLGCTVLTVNPVERRGGLGLFRNRDLRSRMHEALRHQPEVVLVIGVPELEPDLVGELKAGSRATWVNWFPDDLRSVERVVRLAAPYDVVLAAGSDVADRVAAALNRPVELLPLACDPSVYRPQQVRDTQYRANVVFAGRATARREVLLAQVAGFGLAVWGPGWRTAAMRDYCRGEILRTAEFVRAYSGASVAVNIHDSVEGLQEVEASCNQRVFEIAALGVPQVVDYRADLSRWFTPGQDLLTFESGGELRSLVELALHGRPEAERIAANGRRRVLQEHTYVHRMQRLLELI